MGDKWREKGLLQSPKEHTFHSLIAEELIQLQKQFDQIHETKKENEK